MKRFKSLKILLSAFLLFAFLTPPPSFAAKIYIDVGAAKVKKSLLALPAFQYQGSKASNRTHIKTGQELFKTIYNDLAVSSFFQFIDQKAFLEDPAKVGLKPAPSAKNGFNFKNWKTIGTDFLIRGGYNIIGDQIKFEVYLYYVPQAKTIFGKTYSASLDSVRKLAHTFSNDVIKQLTGKHGMFNSKIVVSSDRAGKGTKEIFIMDWDGAHIKKISSHKSVAISPAWGPEGKKVAYTAFAYHTKAKTRNADLFLYELATGKRWLVSYRKGINSGATFHPNKKHIYLTISQGGSPDIFRINMDGKGLTRITNGPNKAMNVEPDISPDGKQIVFSSDRSGKPMIYVMNINGRGVRRLSFAGRYNSTPQWSPDGKQIVFSSLDKGHFDIFVINADGSNLRRLTSAKKRNGKAADNEDPSWSPDGRHILFTSNRTGTNQLYIINPDGTNERRITFDKYSYFKPKWSPRIED